MLSDARLQEPPVDAQPFPCPDYFDNRYVLPQHRIKLLETKNPHPRDDRIVFYEEPHIYTIDGLPAQESVSGLAAEFESEFDADEGIRLMKKSRKVRWPRLQYVVNPRRVETTEEFVNERGAMLVDADLDETVSSIEPGHGLAGDALHTALKDSAIRRADSEHMYVYDRCLTDDEIKLKWALNGEDARNRGTEAHLQMELWFNSEPVRHEEGEVKVGLDFVRRCMIPLGLKGYRTEWTIFGEDENIAGCIDLAAELPNGDIYLIDWKRSEKLSKKMYGFRPMKAPLNHLEDCSGCAYAIQLSSYQYILEKYYGRKIVGRALASIHPDNPFTTAVPYMKDEVEYLMGRRRAMTAARRSLQDKPEATDLLCSVSGRIVMTAVRDGDHRLIDAKVAKLHGIDAIEDRTTTERARALMEGCMEEVTVPVGLKGWKKRFPKPTDDLMFYSD